MRCSPLILLLIPLAACDGGGSAARAPAASPAPGGYVAKVAALPAKQRAGVLLRAIRDADKPCQAVVDGKAAGAAAWVATCDDRSQWVVAIADDGTATVADARHVARRP